MISVILFFISVLALVCLTIWSNNRIGKENQKLIQMTREADSERKDVIEQMRKYEARLDTYSTAPQSYIVGESSCSFGVFGRHSKGNFFGEFSLIKSYPFDATDSESKDFAERNAYELMEILKRGVV